MWSMSRISASSSNEVPFCACSRSSERTASAISCSAAVADGDVDEYPVDVVGGLLGLLEHRLRPGGQDVEVADVVDAPAAVRGEAPHGVLDDVEQRAQLDLGPVQVVGGQHPQGDDLDVRLGAPAEHLGDLVGSGLVALLRRTSGRLRPTTVAVQDDADVLGRRVMVEAAFHPACVEPVHQVAQLHDLPAPPCNAPVPIAVSPEAATLLRGGMGYPTRSVTSP